MTDSEERPLVPGRACGSCTLCCKVMAIEALNKPVGTWCSHCAPGAGCKIHESRPTECRTFYCGYLLTALLGEEWKPDHAKMVLVNDENGMRIVAHVDPQRPTAWKAEPYYSQLKQWSRNSRSKGGQVVVSVNGHLHLVLPDKDVDLGYLGEDGTVQVVDDGNQLQIFAGGQPAAQ